jgi:formylglycine-generating enzyme required for sulfatase activity
MTNTANFNNTVSWIRPDIQQYCNLSSVGTNGSDSFFGINDHNGLVFELLENGSVVGGSYLSSVESLGKTSTITQSQNIRYRYVNQADNNINTSYNDVGFRIVQLKYSDSIFLNNSNMLSIYIAPNDSDNDYGSVDYIYSMSETVITVQQYVNFLNSVDPQASSTLYYSIDVNNPNKGIFKNTSNSVGNRYYTVSSMQNKPVCAVSMINTIRYVNWLHNKSIDINNNTTDTGVYTIFYNSDDRIYYSDLVRSSEAYYALPTVNEWYKSAYYSPNKGGVSIPGYWQYATQNDTQIQPITSVSYNGDGPITYVATLDTPTPTPTTSVTPTLTSSPTATPTYTPTNSATPTYTPTHSPTSTATPSLTPSMTATVTQTPSMTPTMTISPTITSSPTMTPTNSATATPTITPTATLTPTPTVTPTISLSASPLPEYQDMTLTEIYSIKQYKGIGTLSLLNRPAKRFDSDTLPQDWDTFIDNIGIIYGSQVSSTEEMPSYWRSQVSDTTTINSGIYELKPNQTYYFILRNDPLSPVRIPNDNIQPTLDVSIPTVISCSELKTNTNCPFVTISQPDHLDNLIVTDKISAPVSLNVNIENYNPNTSSFDYIYRFKSLSANFPYRITPVSGRITESSKVIGVFEFCNNQNCIDNSFNYEKDKSKTLDDINALVEFSVVPVSRININNSANFNNSAEWNDIKGNLTDIGSNGGPSYYGAYDMAGQLYEWTDTDAVTNNSYKILRGGCYKDTNRFNLSKMSHKIHHVYDCFDEGNFGFRLAYSGGTEPTEPNFVKVIDLNNDSDPDTTHGSVSYEYYINKNMVTNNEYVNFLNTVDPSGYNSHNIYDHRMSRNVLGGIDIISSNDAGNKYVIKPNMNKKPVNFITWQRAAKYCNWINSKNLQAPIDLNNSSYNLIVSDNTKTQRTNIAQYFLPSNNEWYKAAYYSPDTDIIGNYYLYPTQSNEPIIPIMSDNNGIGYMASGICTDITSHNFSVYCEDCLPPPECPAIKLTTHNLSSDYDIVTDTGKVNLLMKLQRLKPNTLYMYEINADISNWPANINKKFDIIETSGNQDSEYISLLFNYCDIAYDTPNSVDYGYLRPFEIIPNSQCGECNLDFSIEPTGLGNINVYKSRYINTILSAKAYQLNSYYSYDLELDPNQDWIDTGVDINNDDIVYIRTSGSVHYGDCYNCYSNADGVILDLDNNQCVYNNNFNYNGLLGKITDNGEEFFVGKKSVLKPASYGRLWLKINNNKDCNNFSGQLYTNISLASKDSSCKPVEDSVNIKCDNCLSQTYRSYAVPRILTPGDTKEITLEKEGCLQYVPLIVEVTEAVPKQSYEFVFESPDDSFEFYPKNGTAFFANGIGKITGLALFKNKIGLGIVKIKLINKHTNAVSTDSITIKCVNEKFCEE